MDRRKLGIVVIVVLLILGVAVFAWSRRDGSSPERAERAQSPTRGEIPEGIQIEDDISRYPTGSRPTAIIPAISNISGAGPYFRDYGTVDISAGEFLPKTIYLRVGDTLHVNFRAVDRAYDVVQPDMGLKLTIAKGESKLMEFMGTEKGKFTFFCESCGGPDKGPRGEFMIIRSLEEIQAGSQ